MRSRGKLFRGAVLALALAGLGSAGWRALPLRPPPTYTEIETGLWLGGLVDAPPPGTTAVLNVSKSPDPYAVPHHRWEPLRNVLPTPTVDWLRRQTDFVAEHRRNGGVVYVHCHGGASRSVLVVAACQMADHGTTRDETLAALRRQRPEVALNPVFLPLLAEWETATRRR